MSKITYPFHIWTFLKIVRGICRYCTPQQLRAHSLYYKPIEKMNSGQEPIVHHKVHVGSVLDGSLGPQMQTGKTQWVSTLYSGSDPSYDSPNVYSTTSSVYNLSRSHEIGCVWLVRHLGADAGEAPMQMTSYYYIWTRA